MKVPRHIHNIPDFIFNKLCNDIGRVLIWTTIAGWVASSTAQIIGIARNPKYTKEQKSFMIPQEIGDALINIGSFFIITTPIKKFSSKLVKTGKIIPASIKELVIQNNRSNKLGKLDFDIMKEPYITSTARKTFNSFNNFMSTTSAVVGGIISSNIVTPILRNKYASNKQAKNIAIFPQQNPINNGKTSSKVYINKSENTTFNTLRHRGMKI